MVEGDIVLEKSGGSPTQSTGRSLLITNTLLETLNKTLVYTNFCIRLRVKEVEFSTILFLEILRLYKEGVFFSIENGTTGIKNLDVNTLFNEYKLCLPPLSIRQEFNEKVLPYFEKIHRNGNEIKSLENLRDYLLPKLLSGEINLSQAEKQVEEVL